MIAHLRHLLLGVLPDHGVSSSKRDPHWPATRHAFVHEYPTCAACGSRKLLNVHHIEPYHVHPERELDPTNLITLCESSSHNCHLIFGHSLDWKAWNPNVCVDAAHVLAAIVGRFYEKAA